MAGTYNISDNNISFYLNGTIAPVGQRVNCHEANFVIHTVVAGIICIIGLLGNTASLYVLNKDHQSPVATFLLQVLAVIDNIFLCLFLLLHSIKHLFYYTNMSAQRDLAWIYTRMYTYPLLFVTQTITIWLTVVIALSRYIAVCVPYRASGLVTMQNAQRCVTAIIVFSMLYNLPRYFESYLSVNYVNGTRRLGLVSTVLGNSQLYILGYRDILYYIVNFALPLLLLIVLNTRLLVAYRAIQAKRAKMNLRQESDNNITLVMIIIILSFIICQGPARIVQIVWSYSAPNCQVYQFYVIQISLVLEVLNSSNNFFIYTALRKQFRSVMLDIFCPCSNCSRLGGFTPVSTNGRPSCTATTYTTRTAVDDNDENCKETFC